MPQPAKASSRNKNRTVTWSRLRQRGCHQRARGGRERRGLSATVSWSRPGLWITLSTAKLSTVTWSRGHGKLVAPYPPLTRRRHGKLVAQTYIYLYLLPVIVAPALWVSLTARGSIARVEGAFKEDSPI